MSIIINNNFFKSPKNGFKPKLMVCVGEPTSINERKFIENYFNTLTLDAYPCMELNLLAFECDKVFNGNPSGGDNTTVIYGGFIYRI